MTISELVEAAAFAVAAFTFGAAALAGAVAIIASGRRPR